MSKKQLFFCLIFAIFWSLSASAETITMPVSAVLPAQKYKAKYTSIPFETSNRITFQDKVMSGDQVIDLSNSSVMGAGGVIPASANEILVYVWSTSGTQTLYATSPIDLIYKIYTKESDTGAVYAQYHYRRIACSSTPRWMFSSCSFWLPHTSERKLYIHFPYHAPTDTTGPNKYDSQTAYSDMVTLGYNGGESDLRVIGYR